MSTFIPGQWAVSEDEGPDLAPLVVTTGLGPPTGGNFLHADRLFAAHGHGRQPVVAVGFFAAHDRVELFLDCLGDRAHRALADLDLVDGTDGGDFGGRAGEERFVADIEHLARDHLLDDRNVQVARDLQRRVARDAGQHRVAEGRGLQHAVAHDEDVLAGAFADESVGVERDAFGVAVHNGFHLDELRVHVVGARLRHGRQCVGRKAGPGRDAHIAACVIGGEVLAPRIVDDVDLGRRVEGIHARLAIATQHDRPDVAGPHAIVGDHVAHGFDDFVAGEIHVDAIDLGGVDQALGVLRGAENRGAAGRRVTAYAFEHRRSVVDDVRHHVDVGVVPGDELAVMPDFVGLLNRHGGSSLISFDAVALQAARLFRGLGPGASKITDDYN